MQEPVLHHPVASSACKHAQMILPPLLSEYSASTGAQQALTTSDDPLLAMQQHVGRVASQMTQQLHQHTGALSNTRTLFKQLLGDLPKISEAFQLAFAGRQLPPSVLEKSLSTHRISAQIDPDCSVGMLHLLWQTISFTTRGNVKPLALALPNQAPRFTGRILAVHGDFFELSHRYGDLADFTCLLPYEIASLYIPDDPNEAVYCIAPHAQAEPPLRYHQADAARQFLLKTVEMVCAGGFLHESR
ncbi:MAG: hypothetical protein VKK59_01330 [Vampirovibrionales bacterium]|nr:hypothetical protein [Vampirovibrionales bacterium]